MSYARTELADAVDRETVRSISKLLLAALSVLLVLYLGSLLPGADWLVPGTPITVAALASAAASLAIVGLLLILAPALAALVRSGLGGPESVADDLALIVQLLVGLTAVLVAHRGLAPAITPLLESTAWLYDVVFLVLSVPLLVVLAVTLYRSLDPLADLLADRIAGTDASTDDAGGR